MREHAKEATPHHFWTHFRTAPRPCCSRIKCATVGASSFFFRRRFWGVGKERGARRGWKVGNSVDSLSAVWISVMQLRITTPERADSLSSSPVVQRRRLRPPPPPPLSHRPQPAAPGTARCCETLLLRRSRRRRRRPMPLLLQTAGHLHHRPSSYPSTLRQRQGPFWRPLVLQKVIWERDLLFKACNIGCGQLYGWNETTTTHTNGRQVAKRHIVVGPADAVASCRCAAPVVSSVIAAAPAQRTAAPSTCPQQKKPAQLATVHRCTFFLTLCRRGRERRRTLKDLLEGLESLPLLASQGRPPPLRAPTLLKLGQATSQKVTQHSRKNAAPCFHRCPPGQRPGSCLQVRVRAGYTPVWVL
jgi:hypothetical protein